MNMKKSHVCAIALLLFFGSATAKIPGTNIPTVGDPISRNNKILFPPIRKSPSSLTENAVNTVVGIGVTAFFYIVQHKANQAAVKLVDKIEEGFSEKTKEKNETDENSSKNEKTETKREA